MNKKIFVSIFALGAIVAGSANAAITKEQCQKSDKTIWVENVQNSDSTRGACVAKNACASTVFASQFCNKSFQAIQVADEKQAELLIHTYAKEVLKWSAGCTSIIKVDANNSTGQDYIGCYSKGNYMTFEFDDTNEHNQKLATDDFKRGLCIALNGAPSQFEGKIVCNGISQKTCNDINPQDPDAYTPGDSSCAMGEKQQSDMWIQTVAGFLSFGISTLYL